MKALDLVMHRVSPGTYCCFQFCQHLKTRAFDVIEMSKNAKCEYFKTRAHETISAAKGESENILF